jgi:hypothetical protein
MPDLDIRTAIDALSARLQAELQAQAAQLTERMAEERERLRQQAEQERSAAVEAVSAEWDGRLQAALADAAVEAEKRLAADTGRFRAEIEGLTRAAAEAAERHRNDLDAQRDEWQGRLQAALAEAAADADRRLAAETDRLRRELEAAAANSVERVREEVKREMEGASARSTAELRAEMERAKAEFDGERTRLQALLADERDRAAAELEGERLKAQTLSAALEEAQGALAREREASRVAEASLAALRSETEKQASDAQALIDARAEERQSHLAIVERLLGAMQAIGRGRSLSDTLNSLIDAAATFAPRVALFVAKGTELRGWRAAGFEAATATLALGADDRANRGLLDRALESGSATTTASEAAPAFAQLTEDRSGLAVPIVVGGRGVAVLYADDASVEDPDAPSAWPEAIQLLAAYASACVAQITAVRTTQALQQQLSAAGHSRMAATAGPATEDDSSARRYARLLVSEIKLYNEAAVRAGREKRDLLTRLQPEIERARRLYEERVSPAVGDRSTYFQQELVHTLADGDAALLGGTL